MSDTTDSIKAKVLAFLAKPTTVKVALIAAVASFVLGAILF